MSAQASRALRLEYVTVGRNLLEGTLALIAAGAATSVAMLGFGLDSLVECLSAGVMIWRLRAEPRRVDGEKLEAVENRARKLVALSLVALAGGTVLDSARALWMRERPEPTTLGIGVLVDGYWTFHRAKEYERAHTSRYADGEVPNPLPATRARPNLKLV